MIIRFMTVPSTRLEEGKSLLLEMDATCQSTSSVDYRVCKWN